MQQHCLVLRDTTHREAECKYRKAEHKRETNEDRDLNLRPKVTGGPKSLSCLELEPTMFIYEAWILLEWSHMLSVSISLSQNCGYVFDTK